MRLSGYWLMLLLLFAGTAQAEPVRVAAASDLRYVMPDLVAEFKKQTDIDIAVTYAASGTLTTQIRHGAPYDLFFSANPKYIELLLELDLTAGEPVDYAQGDLALFAGKHSSVNVDKALSGLVESVRAGQVKKIAIANPQHAPYGQAAVKALEQAGIYQAAQPFLLLAENASQVTQFSLTPDVDAGFIPYTHAIQPKIAARGSYVRLDSKLQQQMVILKQHDAAAGQFAAFIMSEAGRALFIQHGFDVSSGE
jgi:molybdate transport system substrate-binding protein